MSSDFFQFGVINLTFIEPFTKYTLWVRAFTEKHEGSPSEEISVVTDVEKPGKPVIVSLTCQSGDTMYLRWVRPELFYNMVDVYTVQYRVRDSEGRFDWKQQLVETVNNTINHMVNMKQSHTDFHLKFTFRCI